ncbi:MAG: VOC family protein [Pseudomonadota bacterium]
MDQSDRHAAAHPALHAAAPPAPEGLTIGHVHLRVSDLERSIAFYRDVLGLDVLARFSSGAAFLGADGYHHHIGLNTWASLGASPPPSGHTGLYHVAFLYPDRPALGAAIKRVQDAGIALTGAADHGVSEAVYLDDPDRNGIELYRDRARADWPVNADGTIRISNQRLDVAALVAEAA